MKSAKKVILEKGKGAVRKRAKLAYLYEKENQYFAQITESIKALGIKELKEFGAYDIKPVFRGVWFKASKRDLYRINYFSRLISRVLAPLTVFECHGKDDIYKAAKQIHWEEFLTHRKTFSISANVSDSKIAHSNFAGLRVKDAIADYFRDRTNRRPNVDPKTPYIEFNIHINRSTATLSVDTSGGALHKRGYREARVSAPMQETVAAAIVRLSEWDGQNPLVDPMCGSGTLLCEALMHYCRIPAQVLKENFGFEKLPDFDPGLWEQVKTDALAAIRPLEKGLIMGSDKSEDAVAASRTNIMGLHYGSEVTVSQIDFSTLDGITQSTIITNPPYGIRMGRSENMNAFYRDLGTFLKEKCRRSTAFVYFGEPRYIKKMPLAPAWKKPLEIGGLSGKLVKYDLF